MTQTGASAGPTRKWFLKNGGPIITLHDAEAAVKSASNSLLALAALQGVIGAFMAPLMMGETLFGTALLLVPTIVAIVVFNRWVPFTSRLVVSRAGEATPSASASS